MKKVKIEPEKPDIETIKEAGNLLKNGKLVAYPTDTVYGLGADPFNIKAVENLLKVKKRKRELGLPILVSNRSVATRIAEFTPEANLLSKNFWPGALTLVLKTRIKIPRIVTGNRDNIAVRMPAHKVPQLLAMYLGGVLIGTSANISGKPSAVNAEQVEEQIGKNIDMIIDGGIASTNQPSTIVDLTQKPPVILREGRISRQSLEKLIEIKG